MKKFVIANSEEQFNEAVASREDLKEDAVYLTDPSVLFNVDSGKIVILEGAENHPILQNWRVAKLAKAGPDGWSKEHNQDDDKKEEDKSTTETSTPVESVTDGDVVPEKDEKSGETLPYTANDEKVKE